MLREYNLEKQHKRGRLHAIERIEHLLDKGTFVEVNAGQLNFTGMQNGSSKTKYPYDGVITGYGKIHGKKVCVYSQDVTIVGGTVGAVHGKKIADIVDLAVKSHCPVIGINDSGGARIQEASMSIDAYGKVFFSNSQASGVIPQIVIIAGTCAGGACYSPALQDFIFVVDKQSKMFLTGPSVVQSVTGEEISAEELGGSDMHSIYSGVAHYRSVSEEACYEDVRRLIQMLPSSAYDRYIVDQTAEYVEKIKKRNSFFHEKDTKIQDIIPKDPKKAFDVKEVIKELLDDNSMFEIQEEFAPNMVTAFGKLSGILVGIVANNSKHIGGIMNCDCSDKAARFIRYCDAYDIPIITLVDTPGFMPGVNEEKKGIIRHGAKMLYAYSEATTIKITVILRKEYGGACLAMGCKALSVDFCYCWPNAEISIMGADGAIPIIYKKEIALNNSEEERKRLEDKYKESYVVAERALENGYIDDIILPEETRERLFRDIQFLAVNSMTKHSTGIKHNCMPL